MNKLIDALNSFSGWTATDAVLYSENGIDEYIAGYSDKSLMFFFNKKDGYVSKVFSQPIDVSGYDRIGFYVWSRNLKNKANGIAKFSDFVYSLSINGGPDILIPTPYDFEPVFFDISEINEIEKLEFKALTDTEDYFLVSYCVAYTDEYPLDIFQGIETELSLIIQNLYSEKYAIPGTFNFNSGDKVLWIGDTSPWIEKYCAIKITDGTHTEIHQLGENDESGFLLTSLFDGDSMIFDYTNASVSLYIPVTWGRNTEEVILPGITLWGMTPEPIIRGNKLEKIYDTYRSDLTVGYRRSYQVFDYTILVDAEGYDRHMEIIADMNTAIRRFIAREYVWINGKKHFIKFAGSPTWIDPASGSNQIPKIQWEMTVEVNEDIWTRRTGPAVDTDTLNAEALYYGQEKN